MKSALQVMKLLITKFSPVLSTSAAQYQYQNPEFVFFPVGGKPRFTPMQKFDMVTVLYILNFTF
jgi:hypothetical protein